MIILGIETSCDDTAAAVVKDGRVALSNIIASQTDHAKFGGIVPEIASRRHIEAIDGVVTLAMREAGASFEDLSAVAVTNRPGLTGSLLIGLSYAKGLAFAIKKPLIGAHHIEAHICANYIGNGIEPPFICLVVSGGHTNVALATERGEYISLGKTRDDAAGECFDKTARALGLGYPGGPAIDALAKLGNENAVGFPKAKVDGFDFSFSGVKSAVVNYINNHANLNKADVAASFQKAVVDVLVEKTMAARAYAGVKKVALAGGVACNSALRAKMARECAKNGVEFNAPATEFCADNGAMVAARAYLRLGETDDLSLNAYANAEL
ncbi:MAG: tRNA (adenosine(37)-N6)-threonylcarbamoyltransferase complex transferase subunit TsaD [Clostridiales bacterium]|jgi:N6-L-threonylcarbamoyladenine synthase|nr:tRNA (adenosine(37)-N6)-threonylcarbamoyltransferase complex transferase subunit TsaD [Clostridiales bacterium]